MIGYPLFSSSRDFVTIIVDDNDWAKVKVIICEIGYYKYLLCNVDLQGIGKEYISLLQKYIDRPDSQYFGNMGYLSFCETITVRSGKYQISRKKNICHIYQAVKLGVDDKTDEKYYRIQCMLHIPFREGIEELETRKKMKVGMLVVDCSKITI